MMPPNIAAAGPGNRIPGARPRPRRRLVALNNLGLIYRAQQRNQEARAVFERALALARRASARPIRGWRRCCSTWPTSITSEGRGAAAATATARAQAILRNAGFVDRPADRWL